MERQKGLLLFYRKKETTMKIRLSVSLTGIAILISSSHFAAAQTICSEITNQQKVNQGEATADILANSIGRESSLRIKSKKLLKEAQSQIAKAQPSKDFCPDRCTLAPTPNVIFEVIPKSFLQDSSDAKLCEKLMAKTKEHPFEYPNRRFATIDDLSSWFADFSQGKGSDGKDLYLRCTGSCSPQYTSTIKQNSDDFSLDASVLCGQPRDKNENLFTLTTYLVWHCTNRP